MKCVVSSQKVQSQKDKMLSRRSKTIESTSPIKPTKNETELLIPFHICYLLKFLNLLFY